MAHPRKRHDAYGRPLPSLAPVTTPPSLVQSTQNTAMRRYLLWLLEHAYATLFTHEMYAELHVTLRIKQGTIQPDVDVQMIRHHRYEADE